MFSPIYSPRSNGQAERAVQTIKRAVAAWSPQLCSFDAFLHKVLFNLRCTRSGTREKSPSEIIMGRTLRMPIVERRFQPGEGLHFDLLGNGSAPHSVTYLAPKGRNTAWVVKDETAVTVSTSQLASLPSDGMALQEPALPQQEDQKTEPATQVRGRSDDQQEQQSDGSEEVRHGGRVLRDRSIIERPQRLGFPP